MDKGNKYYGLIENLVKKHKKYPGYEAILEDIIDDVYSHSEVVIQSIDNENVIETYLEKVISTSIITVPRKMNFSRETNHRIIDTTTNITTPEKEKASPELVEKMINSSFVDTKQGNESDSISDEELNMSFDEIQDQTHEENDFEHSNEIGMVDGTTINYSEISELEDLSIMDIDEDSKENISDDDGDVDDFDKAELDILDNSEENAEAYNEDENNFVHNDNLDFEISEPEVNDESSQFDYENEKIDIREDDVESEVPLETVPESNEIEPEPLEYYTDNENKEEEASIIEEQDVNSIEADAKEDYNEEFVDNHPAVEDVYDSIDDIQNVDAIEKIDESPVETLEEYNEDDSIDFDSQNIEIDNFDDVDDIEFNEDVDLEENNIEDIELNEDVDLDVNNIEEYTDLNIEKHDIDLDEGVVSEINYETNPSADINNDYTSMSFDNLYDEETEIESTKMADNIKDLDAKRPDLNILNVFNLRYKQNYTIEQITTALDSDKQTVIEALNELSDLI